MRYFQRQPLDEAIQNQLLEQESKDWKDLTKVQRLEIVTKLLSSQKQICAYCECKISSAEGYHHIEHFKERHDDEDLIFAYTNMLLSCEGNKVPVYRPESSIDSIIRRTNISCGHRKTKGHHGNIEIDYHLLLNPTNDVSDLFSYIDGVVEPSNLCIEIEQKQVEYTIKRLNLDAKRLENNRISEMDLIQKSLVNLTENQQKNYIRSLLDESQTVLNPYFSTIKDNFGFMIL
jgi:uncharacterized protein (TIGR02646 family)